MLKSNIPEDKTHMRCVGAIIREHRLGIHGYFFHTQVTPPTKDKIGKFYPRCMNRIDYMILGSIIEPCLNPVTIGFNELNLGPRYPA